MKADQVVLEITESTLSAAVGGGTEALTALKRSGVRIAIDDFGTCSSSLTTLANFPSTSSRSTARSSPAKIPPPSLRP